MAEIDTRYGIDELADLAGVSRRTVRYYVQEGLVPAPFGLGRGRHYGPDHLERILRVKALQDAGWTLDAIRASDSAAAAPAETYGPPVSQVVTRARSFWRRIELAPGLELHVADDVRLPPAARLDELARWCRDHFGVPNARKESEDTHE